MKKLFSVFLLATLLTLPTAAGKSVTRAADPLSREAIGAGTATETLSQMFAEDLVLQSGWADGEGAHEVALRPHVGSHPPFRPLLGFEREVLIDDIAHYTASFRIGEGPYDVIKIHRVVKERRPYRPKRTKKNVFLLHGDAVGFVKFLFGTVSPSAPDDRSAAIFLARNGVDVWGMDQDWIAVPGDETDFAFMADWGLQHQVDNLLLGVRIARFARLFSGNGFGRINVLGYSSGGTTIYAAANQETQLPRGQRHIGGLIPVDIHYKYAPEDESGRLASCAAAEEYQAFLDAGVYVSSDGSLFQLLSEFAATDPDGDSPIIPGLTNLQTTLFFVGATFQVLPFNDWWHYMGTTFEDGLPAQLEYTTLDEALDFLATASPFEPVLFVRDYLAIFCGDDDLPFDDHLGQISVPVLYLGAGGGIGTTGIYTTTLLGSRDVTTVVGSLRPEEEIVSDIGHIDIWTAAESPDVFWQPLLDWLGAH